MRISCPNCAAEYDVPDSALAAGPRLLRCARCEHKFTAALPEAVAEPAAEPPAAAAETPAEPAPAETPAAEPAPPPPPEPARLAQDRLSDAPASPPDRFALAGWLVTLLVLVLAAYAGFAWRAEVMEAWPPSQRLYALLGLA
ncbi:zinc-ribbon domain-containing protein [Falsiroseomonas tokyonensis]|uniref:Zinc-ribbon domain-containing protein n=1 Tax=Falsiroseomonas tokyonensis TaxID=430521 RepID=A0ABV7C0U0_9PROT|nr:zinc-ribbon domain-containing protein [Falsiroseomonas tokyonensis]MBU8541100.1 zinc-ribbon domain-containing protein [Falsiroseomonas tokyonensis]